MDKTAFCLWKKIFDESVSKTISILKSDYLDFLGLTPSEDRFHKFTGPERLWYGSYLREQNLLPQKIIRFALNRKLIFTKLSSIGKANDKTTTSIQATFLTAHETAHGIMDYLRSLNHTLPFQPLSKEEETIADEFGYSYIKTTHSSLRDILDKMKKGFDH